VFTPKWSSTAVVCSVPCSKEFAACKKGRDHAKKKRRAETREMRQGIKTHGEHAKEAQAAFNQFIRLRDRRLPCISCGKHVEDKKYNACHFKSVGANPELRYEESNVHRGCEQCNSYLSGNLVNYRIGLVEKIGLDQVEWLEGPHEPKHYTVDDFQEIKVKYRKLCREIEKEIV
jgi:hypothetical protein